MGKAKREMQPQAGEYEEPPDKENKDSLLEPPEGEPSCLHLDFGLLTSRSVRIKFCCVKR